MIDHAMLKDVELVKLAQGGDSEAFGQLVQRYENKVYRLARRMSETQEDAEDILQDAFIRAFRSISSFERRSTFSTWLYRITMNLALMKLRSRKKNVESLDEPIPTREGEITRDIGDDGSDPLDLLILKDSRDGGPLSTQQSCFRAEARRRTLDRGNRRGPQRVAGYCEITASSHTACPETETQKVCPRRSHGSLCLIALPQL
jgi:RNA polymerase sigma factor (sigma-70 family)